ncbi:superoxide dismutase family protein [Paenibacillus endoradicis]|uniref:superoxide dismutase family protein n=1 Tax=Paenibacillus endoradicis TaxID=2972487 RepID=UPI002159B4D9|nr:superoxide dismutase family protein [Paenibacillus endoradicis]MCR8657172.1 superoxide dismutase family protein [Paenibacillus endoradicis]
MKKILIGLSLLMMSLNINAADVSAKDKVITVSIINTEGKNIGTASLVQDDENVRIHVQAAHLTPGVHGIHIHENGLCDPPDFKTAGGHFNPINHQHGFNNEKGFHNGDLPNIEVSSDGTVDVELVTSVVTLKKGEANSLLKKKGTSLIIHADPDDYVTDPAGNSGARIACGVISK